MSEISVHDAISEPFKSVIDLTKKWMQKQLPQTSTNSKALSKFKKNPKQKKSKKNQVQYILESSEEDYTFDELSKMR